MVVNFSVIFLFGAIFSQCQLGTTEANTVPTGYQCEECYQPFEWICPLPSSPGYSPDCTETNNPVQMLQRIQCFYNGPGGIAYVNQPSGIDADDCGGVANPCQSFVKAKIRFRYNTVLNLADGTYNMKPPANLTGHRNPVTLEYFETYYHVNGTSVESTKIDVDDTDYENSSISGATQYPVVLYVSSPGTSFNVTRVTLTFKSLPSNSVNTVLVWVRNGAVFGSDTTKITGDGKYWPEHLFEQSGGSITLKNTIISPTGIGNINAIQGALLYWNDMDKGSHVASHSGSWIILDSKFENITFNSPDSILSDPNNTNCVLDLKIERSSFSNITSVSTSSTNSRIHNAEQRKALIFNYGHTNGSKSITETSFKDLDSTGHTAPLAVLAEPTSNEDYYGLGLTFVGCTGGSASGTIAAYASINKTNTHFGIKEASDNSIKTVDNTVVPSNTITPMSEGVIVCLENLNVNCPVEEEEPKKFPIWAVVVIIVVAVVVVGAIVVVVAIAVYFHKKKYSTLPDDDYNESSSSSLRSTDRDDEIDSI